MIRNASGRSTMGRMRVAVYCVACAGVALLVAACGSSSSSGSSSSGAKASATGGNGVASKAPAQIVVAAQAALRSANGFVAAGTLTQSGQAMRLQLVDGGSSKLEVQFSGGSKSAEIIVLGAAGYVRANLAFWNAEAGGKAASLANRWIELPVTASQQLTSSLGPLGPSTLSRCLGENLGALSRAGTATVDGASVVVVRDSGNVPGSNPGTLAVATNGPAYPLRVTSTGPTRPGGKVDACNNGKGGNTEGSLTLSDFNHPPAITVPKHPVKLGSAATSSA
jgi:hypothetical protein